VMLCPGQGAQAVGMGRAWGQHSKAASRVFARADEVLGDRFGVPLSRVCFEGPGDVLDRTDVSQPAIYACSLASLAGLCESWGVEPWELELRASAGLSLGEYTALVVGGWLEFETGLELVALRGRAMQEAAERTPSGMVALIGTDRDGDDRAEAEAVCDAARGEGVLVAANFNAPGQVVLSGTLDAVDRAATVAGERGLRATKLAVAGAFHSPLMEPAATALDEALGLVDFSVGRCPVLSNVTGQPHDPDAGSIRRRLVEQLTRPVRWVSNARWVVGTGAGGVHELAPGRTLSGLFRRIERGYEVTSHDGPERG